MNFNETFVCYFCNKKIENEAQQRHMSYCGAVLETCPHKCGSYVPRNLKEKHFRECLNKNRRSLSHTGIGVQDMEKFEAYLNTIKSNKNMRSTKEPAARKLSNMSTESSRSNLERLARINSSTITLENPRNNLDVLNKIQNMEYSLNDLTHKLNRINTNQINTIETHKNAYIKNTGDLDKIRYQTDVLLDWRKTTETKFDSLQKELKTFEKLKATNDITVHNMQETIKELNNINIRLAEQKTDFKTEQINVREMNSDFNSKLQEIKDYFAQENAVVSALWTDQKGQIEKIIAENDVYEKILLDQKGVMNNMKLDLRITTQLCTENTEKLELLEKNLEDVRCGLTQFKLDFELLEDSRSNAQAVVSCVPGRIIWKLTDFKSKMLNAKQSDTVLKGPIFYTSDYGYRIRLMLYLNGMKKWKGRHMLACLHVMNGEYDLMLKWPCKIEGNITLRDLENHDNPKHLVKFITAKREFGNDETEEPQESSNQYIFIPHATLTKSCHLKEDTVFIEINMIDEYSKEPRI